MTFVGLTTSSRQFDTGGVAEQEILVDVLFGRFD